MADHPAQSSDIQQVLPAGFKVVKWLGVGNFGKVCRAQGGGGFDCAFKIIEMNELDRGKALGLKEFRAIRVIRRIKPHRNLIEYLGVWLLTEDGEMLDNADQLQDDDLSKLEVANIIIQMPLAVKSLEDRLKECRREFKKRPDRKPGDLPGIPLNELLPYMRGVAEALDHLHSPIHPLSEKGLGWIMHRDIKPANLLIDRKGDVLVADYGVARAVGTNVKSTQSGAGTPIYSAPEQITDKVDVVDPASDQYSLAITYYELRTGSLPFSDDVYGDVQSLKLAHTLGKLDFTLLPPAEVAVLKRATNRTVNKRYPSCVDFVDELWKANGTTPLPRQVFFNPPTGAGTALYEADATDAPPMPPTAEKGTKEKAGSRTSIELGTTPENENVAKSKTKTQSVPPPPPRPSGTLLLGDLTRPEPAASDTALPLAEPLEEQAPWEARNKQPKSKGNFSLEPDAPAEPTFRPGPKAKSKSNFSIDVPADPPTRPKSTPNFALEPVDGVEPAPSWQTGAKKSSRTLWYVLGGGGAAAAIAAGVYFATAPTPGKDSANNGTTPPIVRTQEPESKPGGTDTTQNPPKNGNNPGASPTPVPPPPPPPVPSADYRPQLKKARESLAQVGDGVVLKITDAVALLETIPGNDAVGTEAKALEREWKKVLAALRTSKPTLADAEAYASWKKPDDLAEEDQSALAKVYARLSADHPRAEDRLQKARAAYKKGADITGGHKQLDAFLELKPAAEMEGKAKAIRSAWADAENFDKSLAAEKPVTVKDLAAAAVTVRDLEKINALADDLKDIRAFYRARFGKLAERFVANPLTSTDAKEWTALADKLPAEKELATAAIDLLKSEIQVLAVILSPDGIGRTVEPLAAPSQDETPAVASYRKLVEAEAAWASADRPQARRDATDKLLAVLADKSVHEAFVKPSPARRFAIGSALARQAKELKQPGKLIDSPFATDNATARKCLLGAADLLKTDADAKLLGEVRRSLLLTAAFPEPDVRAAKLSGLDQKAIAEAAQSLKEDEAASLWLAFARTRDLKTAEDASAAVAAYASAVPLILKSTEKQANLSQFAKYIQDREFLDALPDTAKKTAGEKLFLPLARDLFPRRDTLSQSEKDLIVKLSDRAALLTGSDEHKALAVLYGHMVNRDPIDEAKAKALDESTNHSPTALTLLALAQVDKARGATTDKVHALETAAKSLDKASTELSKQDPDKLVDILREKKARTYLDLGRERLKSADKYRFIKALPELEKVSDLAGDRPGLSSLKKDVLLPRAKCNWGLAEGEEVKTRLAAAKTDLAAIEKTSGDYLEARYYQALIALFEQDLLKGDEKKHYEYGKQLLSGIVELNTARWAIEASKPLDGVKIAAALAAFDNLPKESSPFVTDLLEWRACLMCARANAAEKAERPDRIRDAIAALKDLEAADPLLATLRQLEMLVFQLHLGTDSPEMKELWLPAKDRIAAIQKLSGGTNRLPGSPDRTALQLEVFRLHARAFIVLLIEENKAPKTAEAGRYFAAIREAKSAEASETLKRIGELEFAGMLVALQVNKLKDPLLAVAAARLTSEAFYQSAQADPTCKIMLEYHSGVGTSTATLLGYRSLIISKLLEALNKSDGDLSKSPELINDMVQVDALYRQQVQLLTGLPKRDEKEEAALKQIREDRAAFAKLWFGKKLEEAATAFEKTDPDKARELREWKKKNYPNVE